MLFIVVRRIRDTIMKNRSLSWIVYTLMAFILWFVVLSIVHKFSEGSAWMVAFWMAWETMSTVGYGDAPAVTIIGRISTMIGGSIGIMIMSAFMGAIIVFIEERIYKRRHGMLRNPYSNSNVVVHFPGSQQLATYIIETREVEPNRKICLVDNELDKLPAEIENLGGVHFIKGSMLDLNTHYMTRLHEADAVIIFPRNPNDSESDALTSSLVRLISREVEESVKLIHIILNSKNSHLFAEMRSISVLHNLDLLSVVQEVQDSYSAPIVEQLLRNTKGGNPQSINASDFAGMTWYQLQTSFTNTARQLNVRANLLALVQDGKIDLCPNTEVVITKDDQLSVIALTEFNWQQFKRGMFANNV